jgi:hypothetical protein
MWVHIYHVKDMQYHMVREKIFYVLPHQYSESVFIYRIKNMFSKEIKRIHFYHGYISVWVEMQMLAQMLIKELVNENVAYKKQTGLLWGIKGSDCEDCEKYASTLIFKSMVV